MLLSDLMLANVEAFAGGESTIDPNLGKGMKKVNCTKNEVITGTKCDNGSPTDECHYKRDVTGKCE